MYTLRYPNEQRYRGRKLRTSPLHTRLEVQGACFGETNAYERPMWFANSNGKSFIDFSYQYYLSTHTLILLEEVISKFDVFEREMLEKQ
jgi:glycine cleavage system aminomethyltransferase T